MMIRAETGKPLDLVVVSPRRIDKFILYYRSGNATIQLAEIPSVQISVDKWALQQPLVLEMDGHYILDAVDENGNRISSIGIMAYSTTGQQPVIPQELILLLFLVVILY